MRDPAGVQLNDQNSHIVRSNFFPAPTKGIPQRIYHYSISIFRYYCVLDCASSKPLLVLLYSFP
jgi:hypothetical protein